MNFSTKWTFGVAAIPALGLLVVLSGGRAESGGRGPAAALAENGAAISVATIGSIVLPAGPRNEIPNDDVHPVADAATAIDAEIGDWSLLPERLAGDRSARFRALSLLSSGRIPHGERRDQLIAWLRATGDAEVIAVLDGVLRDLEGRRYAAATADEAELLRRIAGDGSKTPAERLEAIDSVRAELLSCEAVRAALREIAADASDPILARAAVLALAKSVDEDTTRFLAERLLASEADPVVRAAAASALSQRRSELASTTLVASLADPAEDVVVKRFAAQGLRMQEANDSVVRALTEAYHGELDFTIRFNAVVGLQTHAARADVRSELESIFATDPSDDIRATAMAALAMAGHDVERAIEAGRRDASPKVRQMAASLAALKP